MKWDSDPHPLVHKFFCPPLITSIFKPPYLVLKLKPTSTGYKKT